MDEGKIVTVDTPQNLMARLGAWALDEIINGEMETSYFKTREEANRYVCSQDGSFSLRRVNLEDAFIFLTGKKVLP